MLEERTALADALVRALTAGEIAGAALDVTDPEPLPGDHPLLGVPNLLVVLMFLDSLWLIYLQAFVIGAFCQFCLLSAAITTALTVIALLARRTARLS